MRKRDNEQFMTMMGRLDELIRALTSMPTQAPPETKVETKVVIDNEMVQTLESQLKREREEHDHVKKDLEGLQYWTQ
jgi:hypothetical protein